MIPSGVVSSLSLSKKARLWCQFVCLTRDSAGNFFRNQLSPLSSACVCRWLGLSHSGFRFLQFRVLSPLQTLVLESCLGEGSGRSLCCQHLQSLRVLQLHTRAAEHFQES